MFDMNRDGDRGDDGVPDLRLRQMQIVEHNRHHANLLEPPNDI
jgi:hypothetical protein